jgi:hypothetical protein
MSRESVNFTFTLYSRVKRNGSDNNCVVLLLVMQYGVYLTTWMSWRLITVVARSKAWVCGRSLAGIVGSNPAGGMDVCLLWVLCCCQVEVSASVWSLVQRSPTEVWCVWVWSWSLDNEEALRQGLVVGSCECGYEPAGSIKCGEFLERLRKF